MTTLFEGNPAGTGAEWRVRVRQPFCSGPAGRLCPLV